MSVKPRKCKEISRGVGMGLRRDPSHGGGMGIFWNYTLEQQFEKRELTKSVLNVE